MVTSPGSWTLHSEAKRSEAKRSKRKDSASKPKIKVFFIIYDLFNVVLFVVCVFIHISY